MAARKRTRRWALACASQALLAAGACRAFELGDVVPIEDGGGPDAPAPDGPAPDALADAPPGDGACTPSADPCACLTAPTVLSPAPSGNTGEAMVLSGSDLYFLTNPTGGLKVLRVPVSGLDGGAPVEVTGAGTFAGAASAMVLGGSWLFFRHTSNPFGLNRFALGGPAQPPGAYFGPLESVPVDMAVDSARIYFTNNVGAVCAVPLNGAGPPADAGPSGCGAPPIIAARDGGPSAAQIAVSASYVYVASSGRIDFAPLATGVLQPLVTQQGSIASLTESGGHLFWMSPLGSDGGAVWTAADDGTGVKAIAAAGLNGTSGNLSLAADADGVYWGARTYPKIWASGRDGSNTRLLACEPAGIAAITSDASFVYWLTSDSAVKRRPKN